MLLIDATNINFEPIDMDYIPTNTFDFVDTNNIGAVNANKLIGRQFFGQSLHGYPENQGIT